MKNASISKPKKASAKKVIVQGRTRVEPLTEHKATHESSRDIYKIVMDALKKSAPDSGKVSQSKTVTLFGVAPQIAGYTVEISSSVPVFFETAENAAAFAFRVLKQASCSWVSIKPVYTSEEI